MERGRGKNEEWRENGTEKAKNGERNEGEKKEVRRGKTERWWRERESCMQGEEGTNVTDLVTLTIFPPQLTLYTNLTSAHTPKLYSVLPSSPGYRSAIGVADLYTSAVPEGGERFGDGGRGPRVLARCVLINRS